MNFQSDIPLKNYTTFNIGGPARYFVSVKSLKQLEKAFGEVQDKELPYFILGGGSNLLVSSTGFEGLIIKIDLKTIDFIDRTRVKVGAGVYVPQLLDQVVRRNLSGLEWAVGIPASVGGLVYSNAGAFDCCIADYLQQVEAYSVDQKEIKEFSAEELDFSYRQSLFSDNNLIITSVLLDLERASLEKIEALLDQNLSRRRESQPLGWPSAGSVFKNPADQSAGYLIDQVGLKGKQRGGAQISEKHANFIVNKKEATSEDVIGLIKLAQQEVRDKFNIKLEPELQFLPPDVIDNYGQK